MDERIKIPLNYGSMAGGLAFLFFLIYYAFGFNPIGNITWLTFWIPIPFIVMGIKKFREEQGGGYITYGNAFRIGFIISFMYASLFAMLVYLFGAFIDGSFIEDIIATTATEMENNREMMISLMGEEYYEQTLNEILELTIGSQAMSEFFNKMLFTFVSTLIAAGFLKKKPPFEA